MSTKSKAVRAPRSTAVLWGWTFVSTILHAVLIGGLCAWSYMGHAKEEAAAKAEADAAAKASAEKPAATPPAATPGEKPPQSTTSTQGSGATPAPVKQPDILPPPKEPGVASPSTQPPSAEKILGIDQTAKPGDTPKSPFAGGTDDLLKDLK